jgi:DNA-binding NtrC family response regulator
MATRIGMGSGTVLRAQRPRSAVVVIDDEGLSSAIIELLRDLGWETWEVESFRDARDAISLYRPGVLVVDPGLHVDLLERFIARLEGDVGVVVLSDLASVETIASEHHVSFVQEPFDLEELAETIERARYDLKGEPAASARRR